MLSRFLPLLAAAFLPAVALGEDVVRLGNLKFAHYGAVSYMKEIAPKYNLRIEEKMFAKGIDIVPAVIAGEIDVTASAADGAIAGRAKGVPVYVMAGFSDGGSRIVGRSDEEFKGVADLKGKKVGVARGGAQELALYAELDKVKLTWSDKPGQADVQILFLAYADLNQALMQKQIDAMCQSEPQSTQAITKGFGKEIIKPYDTPIKRMTRVLVMTEKMYQNRDLASRVMRCFVEATQTFLAKPDVAEKYVREQMFKGQYSSEEYRDAMSNAAFTYDVTTEEIQITTDYMVKFGVGQITSGSAKPPVATEWVKTDLLMEAKKAAGVK